MWLLESQFVIAHRRGKSIISLRQLVQQCSDVIWARESWEGAARGKRGNPPYLHSGVLTFWILETVHRRRAKRRRGSERDEDILLPPENLGGEKMFNLMVVCSLWSPAQIRQSQCQETVHTL
jgi:hypothetical protein